jgi:nucleoside-diphosphate-sugar epimerase
MTVVVTGGAGFVGSHLVDALCRAGKDTVVLDDLSSGSLRNLESAITKGATFVYADVGADSATLRAAIGEATSEPLEAIFHLASPASPEAYGARPWETLRVNGLGTMSLIDIALEHGARFVFTSTSEVYGRSGDLCRCCTPRAGCPYRAAF